MLKHFGIRHTLLCKQRCTTIRTASVIASFSIECPSCTGVGGSAANLSTKSNNVLRHTLNLPQTQLPMKANASKREPLMVARTTSKLYRWQQETRRDSDSSYVLHDGPPYANGSLHMGHLLNKTLKDISNRFQLLRGKRVDYIPGWDCHGLPIELVKPCKG